MIQLELGPVFPVRATSIGSGLPSPAQISVGSLVEIFPPSTSQALPPPFSAQIVGLACAAKSLELSPSPSYSSDSVAPNAGTKSPVDQMLASTATLDRWWPVDPHST